MTTIGEADRAAFFRDGEAATRKAIGCALATQSKDGAHVRSVHPTWDAETPWFATGTGNPKTREIAADRRVDVQFQVAPPDFVHLLARGRARSVGDSVEKKRVWDVIDYDLSAFWPGGPTDPNYTRIRIDRERVELSKPFGSQDKKPWRRA